MSELFANASKMTYTENGARTFTTSCNSCLDFFSVSGALRQADESRIIELFEKAFNEDPLLAIEILFYTRDIRSGGLGEKRVFRLATKHLPQIVSSNNLSLNRHALYDNIVRFGSWKDLFEIFQIEEIGEYVAEKMKSHMKSEKYDLLEKWAPSIGGSKNRQAEYLAKLCGITPKQYRKYLSAARAQLKVVETFMCANRWSDIEYDRLPSKASLIYKNSFLSHDNDRYRSFLKDVALGKKTINTRTLYPYEIVREYFKSRLPFDMHIGDIKDEDASLEVMWNNLPDYVDKTNGNAIVVADTSGSMYGDPILVSISLAIYLAERNSGKFHNEFMTFSSEPSFISLDGCESLKDKVAKVFETDWGVTTDLVRVFKEILDAGNRYHLPESEMPKTVYVVTDMEFDRAVVIHSSKSQNLGSSFTPTVYETVKELYKASGYELPSIIFWNVNSHQNNVPVVRDEIGTALVSGCSPSLFKTVVTKDIDPTKMMLQLLGSCKEWEEAARSILQSEGNEGC